jgi:predicted metalloprotease with PDZ domain
MNSVNFQFDITDISAHLLLVTLTFKPSTKIHQLALPAWIPGSYMIRDFARNIISLSASDNSGSLALQQLDKQRWQLVCHDDIVTVRYLVYANDLSVRAAYIDDEVAVLNPACLCLAVSAQQHLPHQIQIINPASATNDNWRVATGLAPDETTPFLGFGLYHADSYQTLIDSPILAGIFTLQQFEINQVNHYLVVSGDNLTDLARFSADLKQICQQQVEVFTALPQDLTSYWFLLWVTEEGYGGLEHLNSTLLLCSRFDLPAATTTAVDEHYQNLLALCSHEYFHTWWVKRLKPACFHQYQLQAEQYTPQLWFYEGVTSYFDDIALLRAGLIELPSYIRTLEKTISRVTRNPSDSVQSLSDSSFTAWTKFYKQDENAVNAVVSYYAKGALLALCLDACLRDNSSSLAEIVRAMWQRYLATGTEDNALSTVLTELGFTELAQQLQIWLHDAKPLPLEQLLPKLGLELSFRSMQHAEDLGGQSDSDNTLFIGALTKTHNGLVQLSHIYHGSAAHQAGLMTGDQLLALDGRKITANNFVSLLARYKTGSIVAVHFYRKDRLLQASLTLCDAKQLVAVLNVADAKRVDAWITQA